MNRAATLLLISGLASGTTLAQPCGNPWSQSAAEGPSPRIYAPGAYDSARSRVVLFGGSTGNTPLGDTWEWAASGPGGGGTWTLRANTGPSPRILAGLAYDSSRQKTVLFGGQNAGGNTNNQTWEWDGLVWTQIFPQVSPPAMIGKLMAYDTSRQRTVLVSSLQSGAGAGVTWEYDGQTWSTQPGPTPIASIPSCSLAYDAARATMVLTGSAFGAGWSGGGTWERTASGWSALNEHSVQSYVYGATSAYDPVRSKVLYFDSNAYSGKTGVWAWDGTIPRWQAISSNGPALAFHRTAVYDAAGGQMVVFGGMLSNVGAVIAETWLLRSDSRSGPKLTDIGQRTVFVSLYSPPFALNVAAAGTEPISYRWRLNGVELSDGGSFSGAGTPQLTINPNDRVYSGSYDAVVTDACGTTIRPATFVRIECYPNCDGSTSTPMLNAEDFQCFLNQYASGDAYANCDGSSSPPILNTNDFQCFINKFAQGCP